MEGEDVSKDIAKFESKHISYQESLHSIRFTAWDMLTLDEYYNRYSERPYYMRFDGLEKTLNGFKALSVVENRLVSTIDDVLIHFYEVIYRNGEGCVVKSMNGVWADTKPSYQIKKNYCRILKKK